MKPWLRSILLIAVGIAFTAYSLNYVLIVSTGVDAHDGLNPSHQVFGWAVVGISISVALVGIGMLPVWRKNR